MVRLHLAHHRVLDGGDRCEHHVVLILEAVRAPLLQHPDDPEPDAVELHVAADRVVALVPQLLDHGLAHHRHLGVVGLVLLVDDPAVLGHGVADLGEDRLGPHERLQGVGRAVGHGRGPDLEDGRHGQHVGGAGLVRQRLEVGVPPLSLPPAFCSGQT